MIHCLKNLKSIADKGESNDLPYIYAAIPVLDELELLPRLMKCIANQNYRRFTVYVCINQPDDWWTSPDKSEICSRNVRMIEDLGKFSGINLVVLDHSSKGKGWKGKRHGVGWARKVLLDAICKAASPDDIMINLDADTIIPESYFLSVAENFHRNPRAVALANPYFHPAVTDEKAYRAILRYEIYMRHYFLNLARIGNPYTFTALGSAISCRVSAYHAVGGLTPKKSGEDFYFLQKLRKYGDILLWNEEKVYPEARFSDRVFFGTGPAMIKGNAGDWSSYPIYPYPLFNDLLETILLFPVFYIRTLDTKITRFLSQQFNEEDPWQPLRENAGDMDHFIRACHEKLDGLRILQYLKTMHRIQPSSDEKNLGSFLERFYEPEEVKALSINLKEFSFRTAPLDELERIRQFLAEKEDQCRLSSAQW